MIKTLPTLMLVSLMFPLNALAEDDADPAGLQEITVTAQRREQSLQNTPVAVSAFSAREIESRQISSTLDVISHVPNFAGSHNTGPGTSNSYWLRGIGNGESLATFDVPVGTYVDDVYIARQNANDVDLLDVDRLEVLRGPQGTLFGRNTTGGAINIVTRKPSPERSLRADVEIGRFDRARARISADLPVSSTLMTKLTAFWVTDDGPVRSVTNGAALNVDNSWGTRAALRWLPSDSVEWNLSAEYSEVSRLNQGTALIPGGIAADGETASSLAGDFFKAYTDSHRCRSHGDYISLALQKCGFNFVTTEFLTSNISLQTVVGDVQFITGYRNSHQTFVVDFLDNSPAQIFGPVVGPHYYIANDGKHEQFSQEIKLTGASERNLLRYTIGAFFMGERNRTKFADLIGEPAFVLTDRYLANKTESYAAYAQLEFDIASAWTLIFGARETREVKDIELLYRPTFGQAFTQAALAAYGYPTDHDVRKTTPKVAVQYRPTEGVMLYASATNGFKSGGWNARTDSPQLLNDFGPETVWSYEMGLRSEMLDHRLRVNATVFQANYKDLQVATELPGTSSFVTTNAGDSRVRGAEIEVTAAPISRLEFFASLGLQDAKFVRLSTEAINTGFTAQTVPLRSPDYTINTGFQWTIAATRRGRFVISSDVNFTDNYYYDYPNLPYQEINQPALWNAGVRWAAPGGIWEAAVECKNCLDKHWSTVNLFGLAYPADPLQWIARVSMKL